MRTGPDRSVLGRLDRMTHRFSLRTSWDTAEGPLAGAVRRARAAGRRINDLTISNPTVCGFDFDSTEILGALGNPAAMTYDPDPRGMLPAREAVAQYCADHRAPVDPNRVVLTTSTSEAYSFLFRLLCDPGDSVLVAQPSYPLFDFLADLHDIRLEPYGLFHDFGWWIDLAEIERRITPRTRAILLVHPNNPTGHASSREERTVLEELCERHGLTLIVDEVFLDYGLSDKEGRGRRAGLQGQNGVLPAGRRPAAAIESFAVGPHPCLTFIVSGLSKIAALPQMKVGWIAAAGPPPMLDEAMARLEMIADTFLSVNAPAQYALPQWLAGRGAITGQIVSRLTENLGTVRHSGIRFYEVEAGWTVILRLPQWVASSSEDLALALVDECGIIVHPGSFYGMASGNFAVVSLLTDSLCLEEGLRTMKQWCESKELT